MADQAIIDELQDMLVSQRAALVAVWEIIHRIAPDDFQERLRMQRLLAQAPEIGTFRSGSERMTKIHGLVRDILEEAAGNDEHLDDDDE